MALASHHQPLPAPTCMRPATSADIERLLVIENICFTTDRLSRRSFRRFIEGDAHDLLVLEHEGRVEGYALILYRRGTAVARLYSIALDPAMRGKGVGKLMMEALEETAYDNQASVLRLEVRQDNIPAIAFYQSLGYRRFGRIKGYYEDGMDADRYQKWLSGEPPASLRKVPYYAQTTDFTCGPSCLMMAQAALRPDDLPQRTLELRLWREATTIHMLRGHGGCEPIGLANAMARRGFEITVYRSQPGPYFLDSVRHEKKREIMRLVQADYAEEAALLGIGIVETALTREQLIEALDQGKVVVVLVSHYRLTRSPIPHWVMVYGHDEHRFYIHDPWVEKKENPDEIFHGASLPIPHDEFDRLTRYGRSQLRTALVIGSGRN